MGEKKIITTIGADPGLYGAVGILRDGKFVAVIDIPTTLKGSGYVKYEIDPAGLKRLIEIHFSPGEEIAAIVERVNAMPGGGSPGTFSLGDSYGVCRAVMIAGLGLVLYTVTPQQWKKFYNISSNKEEARALAIRMFPGAELHLKKHTDRAEALLMANYLWEKQYK